MLGLPPDLDLNLLRILDALLQTRSVTEAARQLGRSQSAVSHALARLRDALDDQLLVRQGRALVPTPRAEAIGPALHAILLDLGRALDRTTAFDPATAQRTFRLGCPDVMAPLLPPLLAEMSGAPGCRVELVSRRGVAVTAEVDVLLDILPEDAPGVVARRLGTVTRAVASRRDHRALGDASALSMAQWLAVPHVFVRTGEGGASQIDRSLVELGLERRIGLVAPTMLLALHAVSESELLFTGPREMMQLLARPLSLVLRDPPLELPLPPVPAAAMWQERLSADPGHRWFRERVAAVVAAALAAGSEG